MVKERIRVEKKQVSYNNIILGKAFLNKKGKKAILKKMKFVWATDVQNELNELGFQIQHWGGRVVSFTEIVKHRDKQECLYNLCVLCGVCVYLKS